MTEQKKRDPSGFTLRKTLRKASGGREILWMTHENRKQNRAVDLLYKKHQKFIEKKLPEL